MKINYVISNRKTGFKYMKQMFDNHCVNALQIYAFEADDMINDIIDYHVQGCHRAKDEDGLPFDVVVLVNDYLEVKRDLIFWNGKLYISGIYGKNIDHIGDEYVFIERG